MLLRILRTQPEHAARVVRLLTTFMAMGSVRWRVHERMTAMAFEAAKLPQGIPHGIPHAHGMRLGPTPPQPTGYALGLDDGFVSHGVGGSSAKLDVRKGKHVENGTVVERTPAARARPLRAARAWARRSRRRAGHRARACRRRSRGRTGRVAGRSADGVDEPRAVELKRARAERRQLLRARAAACERAAARDGAGGGRDARGARPQAGPCVSVT